MFNNLVVSLSSWKKPPACLHFLFWSNFMKVWLLASLDVCLYHSLFFNCKVFVLKCHKTSIFKCICFTTSGYWALFLFTGPVLEIVNASTGLVYSTGSYLSIECVYSNTSRAQVQTTTQHPLFPLDQRILLKHDVLNWKFNNRTFSLQNRKRY